VADPMTGSAKRSALDCFVAPVCRNDEWSFY